MSTYDDEIAEMRSMTTADFHALRIELLRRLRDANEAWRTCRRRACRRASGCCSQNYDCASVQPPSPPCTPEEERREVDILRRMLDEEIARRRAGSSAPPPTSKPGK